MAYPTPLPQLALYESHMASYGATYAQQLIDFVTLGVPNGFPSQDYALATIYYDASRCYWDIYNYTGRSNTLWRDGALAADTVYTTYLVSSGWNPQNYRKFAHGFMASFNETGDVAKRSAVMSMRAAALCNDVVPVSYTEDVNGEAYGGSREVAYILETYICAEKLGGAKPIKRDAYIAQALSHLRQWTVTLTATYLRPFMQGLTSRALIEMWEHDPTNPSQAEIIPQLIQSWNYTWNLCWLPAQKTFMYTDRSMPHGGQEPAHDLNLLIAPVFAWLYRVTGDTTWIDKGDQIFEGGVTGAWLGNGKQFHQNYCWSNRYIEWREATPLTQGGGGGGEDPPPDGGGGGEDPPPGGGGEDPGSGGGSGGGGSSGGTYGGNNTISTLATTPQPALYLPIEPKSWEQKFQRNGWANIQEMIDDGFRLWLHPGSLEALFEEVVDIGALIFAPVMINVAINPVALDGEVTVVTSISLSADAVTWDDYAGASQVFAGNFRYVKVKLEAEATSLVGIVRIDEVRVTLSLKEKRDAGSGEVTSAAAGATVTFNKDFIDVDSIVPSAAYQSALGADQPIAVYEFTDVPNPTTFKVYLVNSTGKVTGKFSWQAKGA